MRGIQSVAVRDEVYQVLAKDPVVINNWEQILHLLDGDPGTSHRLRSRFNTGNMPARELFETILHSWVSKKGDVATIGSLIDIPRQNRYLNAADMLAEAYGLHYPGENFEEKAFFLTRLVITPAQPFPGNQRDDQSTNLRDQHRSLLPDPTMHDESIFKRYWLPLILFILISQLAVVVVFLVIVKTGPDFSYVIHPCVNLKWNGTEESAGFKGEDLSTEIQIEELESPKKTTNFDKNIKTEIGGFQLTGGMDQRYFTVLARNLPDEDRNSESDPFLVIRHKKGQVLCRTKSQQNTLNPSFTVSLDFINSEIYRFEFRDEDDMNRDDKLGSVNLTADHLIGTYKLKHPSGGTITIEQIFWLIV